MKRLIEARLERDLSVFGLCTFGLCVCVGGLWEDRSLSRVLLQNHQRPLLPENRQTLTWRRSSPASANPASANVPSSSPASAPHVIRAGELSAPFRLRAQGRTRHAARARAEPVHRAGRLCRGRAGAGPRAVGRCIPRLMHTLTHPQVGFL